MNKRLLGAAVVALAAAGGCAGPFTDVTKTDVGYDAPTDANTVEILYLRPNGTYKEIASVVTDGWNLHDVAKLHNAVREKAAAAGANTVVLIQPHYTIEPYFGTPLLGWVGVAIKK